MCVWEQWIVTKVCVVCGGCFAVCVCVTDCCYCQTAAVCFICSTVGMRAVCRSFCLSDNETKHFKQLNNSANWLCSSKLFGINRTTVKTNKLLQSFTKSSSNFFLPFPYDQIYNVMCDNIPHSRTLVWKIEQLSPD